jgi:solute carrier family 31 (copper transporter), member 1
MFASSCVGVICLVITLEFLRRLQRAYERHIVQQAGYLFVSPSPFENNQSARTGSSAFVPGSKKEAPDLHARSDSATLTPRASTTAADSTPKRFRLNIMQQIVRATLHMLQFGVAYFIMLLAMYYNGYFIICILVGAFVGYFAFAWDNVATAG